MNLPQTETFFGLVMCICYFWFFIAKPHHVRFKVMEYKHIRYEISLDSNGKQMVEGTKKRYSNELLKKTWKFHVSHFIFLHTKFQQQQKMHAGCCYWCKIGVKWPNCSNRETSLEISYISLLPYVMARLKFGRYEERGTA